MPGALVIFTGPSHSGKTSAARGVLRMAPNPAAHVAIDELMSWMDRSAEDAWDTGLPVAYELAREATAVLLQRGFTVFLESTFTFIPPDDRPAEFHRDELARFLDLARTHGADVVVIRLVAELDELLRRRQETGRFPAQVVEGTWQQHRQPLPAGTPVVNVVVRGLAPDEIGDRALEALDAVRRVV